MGRFDQPDVAVNPRSRIPPRRRLLRSVDADSDDVVAAEIHVAGQVVAETDITVGPVAEMKTVDPDVAVRHHPVELDKHAAIRFAGRQGKMFPIPADTTG